MTIKYIFCINAGRSGSEYLQKLLANAQNTISIHEDFPVMNGAPMIAYNEGDENQLHQWMPLKVRTIRQKRPKGKVYCETNHSYIKGWGYLLPDEYIPQDEIGVIILRRDVSDNALSLLRLHDVPGASEMSRTWYLSPGAKKNLSEPSENANPYELCQWYVKEVHLRARAYKQQFPRIKYFECELEQLNDYDFVVAMLAEFGLTPSAQLRQVVGQRFNIRTEWPKLSLDQLLAPSGYPGIEHLTMAERDSLIAQIVDYLRRNKAAEIAAITAKTRGKRHFAIELSQFFAVVKIFADAERELEEEFRHSLMFSEIEIIVIHELLRAICPADFAYLVSERVPPPGIRYIFDFNTPITVRLILRKVGWKGFWRLISTLIRW